jgi:hypothetical protein
VVIATLLTGGGAALLVSGPGPAAGGWGILLLWPGMLVVALSMEVFGPMHGLDLITAFLGAWVGYFLMTLWLLRFAGRRRLRPPIEPPDAGAQPLS